MDVHLEGFFVDTTRSIRYFTEHQNNSEQVFIPISFMTEAMRRNPTKTILNLLEVPVLVSSSNRAAVRVAPHTSVTLSAPAVASLIIMSLLAILLPALR